MSISCDTQDLLDAAKCFQCIPPGHQPAVRDYILCNWANGISPFTPDTIPGLVLWLDANQGVTLVGGGVSQWDDQSSSGNDFSQASAGNRPTYSSLAINGHPSIQFDGSVPQWLLGGPGPNFSFSLFTVQAIIHGHIDVNPIIGCDGLLSLWYGGDPTIAFQTLLTWYNGSGNTTIDSGVPAFDDPFLAELTDDGTNIPKIYFNGTLEDTLGIHDTDNNALNAANLVVGLDNTAAPTYQFWGSIGEILIYNSVLSDTDRHRVEFYLNNKWSLGF